MRKRKKGHGVGQLRKMRESGRTCRRGNCHHNTLYEKIQYIYNFLLKKKTAISQCIEMLICIVIQKAPALLRKHFIINLLSDDIR